jgi:hypothetical protein
MLSGTHLTETIGITFLRHILDEFLYVFFASLWNNRAVSSAISLFTLNLQRRQSLPVDYNDNRQVHICTDIKYLYLY